MKTVKTTFAMFSLFAVLLVIGSCKKEDILPEQPETTPESQLIIDHLVNEYGFARESIKEMPEEFVAEGDIVFPKDSFWQHYGAHAAQHGADKHYKHTSIVSQLYIIPVRISSNVPASWKTAFLNAIIQWNSRNGRVSFQYCDALNFQGLVCGLQLNGVYVKYQNLNDPDVFANANLPVGGYPGTTVRVNSGYTGPSLNSDEKLKTAIHELGHTLGLRHTDAGEGTLINTSSSSCNTNTDPNSVMRQGKMPFYGFSTCDSYAFQKLYGR